MSDGGKPTTTKAAEQESVKVKYDVCGRLNRRVLCRQMAGLEMTSDRETLRKCVGLRDDDDGDKDEEK